MNVDRVLVRELTTRLSGRLVDAIETDTASSNVPGFGAADGQRRVGVREDRARLELLMGRWMAEEIARLNQTRLQRGDGLLDEHTERELRPQRMPRLSEPVLSSRTCMIPRSKRSTSTRIG